MHSPMCFSFLYVRGRQKNVECDPETVSTLNSAGVQVNVQSAIGKNTKKEEGGKRKGKKA